MSRLYRERESDKYTAAKEAAMESLMEYKKSVRSRRVKNDGQVMKTVPFGSPTSAFIKPSSRAKTI